MEFNQVALTAGRLQRLHREIEELQSRSDRFRQEQHTRDGDLNECKARVADLRKKRREHNAIMAVSEKDVKDCKEILAAREKGLNTLNQQDKQLANDMKDALADLTRVRESASESQHVQQLIASKRTDVKALLASLESMTQIAPPSTVRAAWTRI
jgi:chromosome segregation ATPase